MNFEALPQQRMELRMASLSNFFIREFKFQKQNLNQNEILK